MIAHDGLNRAQAYTLYLNHALSTWSARSYEFAAILFTASAFPKGLRAASLIGVCTTLAAILFGTTIGRWIDRGTSRLRTLLATISINRLCIVAACVLWAIIVSDAGPAQSTEGDGVEAKEEDSESGPMGWKMVIFSILLLITVAESLSRKANVISIERDWVPVLAPAITPSGYTLTHVNAMMSRIDIIAKLAAPVAISAFFSIVPIRVGVFAVLVMNGASFLAELWSARSLWNQCAQLTEPKASNGFNPSPGKPGAMFNFRLDALYKFLANYREAISIYFNSDVWMPSLAMCVTHASILSVTGVTVVFFLDSGYSLRLVTGAEALSTIFELGSTLVYPYAVRRIVGASGKSGFAAVPQAEDEHDLPTPKADTNNPEPEAEVVDSAISRVGLSGSLSMASVLLPAVPILLYLTHVLPYPIARTNSDSPTLAIHPLSTALLFLCLASSRLGRGLFSLSTQQLAQSRLPPHRRSSFAGMESSLISSFGLLHNLGTAVWSQPRSFGWLALGSWVMVGSAATLYLRWWARSGRRRRGADAVALGVYSPVGHVDSDD